ncbi:hypothetical protein RSPO_c01026 [Ralstonia solanacearum Po82]|uniref:Uncharacterized protein n=1 Tax=Ralstonia solanacearum (strain Po82) TaxID=1031711 RepID=F6FZP0_RALS8|nr:hypothetical protein RSPO_c01026 [Ralstonia solanacearum Po82]
MVHDWSVRSGLRRHAIQFGGKDSLRCRCGRLTDDSSGSQAGSV